MTNTITSFLEYNLDSLYGLVDYTKVLRDYENIQNLTRKHTVGSPGQQFCSGLDYQMPKPRFNNVFETLSFNQFLYYKSLKQNTTTDLTTWNPDKCVFTPEGIGTLEYSPWKQSPLSQGTSSLDRVSRISYGYTGSRMFPLRGPSGTAFTAVEYFTSAFWLSVTDVGVMGGASFGPLATATSASFNIPKSYFMACRFFDVNGYPCDIKAYIPTTLASNFASDAWTNLNVTYYGALSPAKLSVIGETATAFTVKLDFPSGIPLSPSYQHVLFCAGSDYIPSNSVPTLAAASGVGPSAILSALKFIDDYNQPVVQFPKNYDYKPIKTVYNTNQSLVGLQGLNAGDVVLVTDQDIVAQNGLYAVAPGAWTSLESYMPKNYNFVLSQDYGLTGSRILASRIGEVFDADIPPTQQLVSTNDNSNPAWIMFNFTQGNTLSQINYSGSVYDDFGLRSYSYDITNVNAKAESYLNYADDTVGLKYRQLYFIPQGEALGRASGLSFTTGSIVTLTGSLPAVNIGSMLFLLDTPSDWAVGEVLYSTVNSVQLIIKKVFGAPSSTSIKIYSGGSVCGDLSVKSEYNNILETYQRQLVNSFLDFESFPLTSVNLLGSVTKALVYQNSLDYSLVKALALNPKLLEFTAIQQGQDTDYADFNFFSWYGFLKSFSQANLEGIRLSPQVNFLDDDIEYTDKIYEGAIQASPMSNCNVTVTNSVTSQKYAVPELDFSYLDIDSVYGEAGEHYSSVSPYFTGPNVVRNSDKPENRVAIQYQYGNPYVLGETMYYSPSDSVVGKFSSFNSNKYSLGTFSRPDYSTFWSAFTGPYLHGLALSNTVFMFDELTNPLNNISNTLTKKSIYQYAYTTGSQSELVFNGAAVFIPLPSVNFSSVLKTVEVFGKFIGQNSNAGFLRARIIDLTDFYSTNDTSSIRTLAASEIVNINYLSTTYDSIKFTFQDNLSFFSRLNSKQSLYLEIEKLGDFNPGVLILRCANQAAGQITQYISGSPASSGSSGSLGLPVYSNLTTNSSIRSFTGSVIYNLYEYIGNPIYVTTSVQPPNTFATTLIRFPYYSNTTNVSYNQSSDYVNVVLSGSPGLFTGPPLISLSSALGRNAYSFTMYSAYTGPTKQLIIGASGVNVNQKPNGFHLLFSVDKYVQDSLPNAMVELERDFVYNALCIPETNLYMTSGSLKGAYMASNDNQSLITPEKRTIGGQISNLSTYNFVGEKRKRTFITPNVGYTGSVLFGGFVQGKNVDMLFKRGSSQVYQRTRIAATPGMLVNVQDGGIGSGISTDTSALSPIATMPLSRSQFNATGYTGPNVLSTNIFLNFYANSNISAIRVLSTSGSLLKVQNITTNAYTGPTASTIIQHYENLTSGSFYQFMVTVYGVPSSNTAIVEYYDSSFKVFSLAASGSMFPAVQSSQYIEHPSNLALTDVWFIDNNEQIKPLLKRFTR